MTTRRCLLLAALMTAAAGCADRADPAKPTTSTTTSSTSTTSTSSTTTTTVRASRARAAPTTARPAGPALLERIARCESGGSYTAQNRHSTASGKYQYLDSTWNNYRGYRRAMHAPPAVQEERARADFARLGTRPWTASRHCWTR